MSAIDKLKSFAETREPGKAVIRDGLTYGDARDLVRTIEWAQETMQTAHQQVLDRNKLIQLLAGWATTFGQDLRPTEGKDTFGEGVRACKAAVASMLRDYVPESVKAVPSAFDLRGLELRDSMRVAVEAARIAYLAGHNDTVDGAYGDPEGVATDIVHDLIEEAENAAK